MSWALLIWLLLVSSRLNHASVVNCQTTGLLVGLGCPIYMSHAYPDGVMKVILLPNLHSRFLRIWKFTEFPRLKIGTVLFLQSSNVQNKSQCYSYSRIREMDIVFW